jgi:hypothetical protein
MQSSYRRAFFLSINLGAKHPWTCSPAVEKRCRQGGQFAGRIARKAREVHAVTIRADRKRPAAAAQRLRTAAPAKQAGWAAHPSLSKSLICAANVVGNSDASKRVIWDTPVLPSSKLRAQRTHPSNTPACQPCTKQVPPTIINLVRQKGGWSSSEPSNAWAHTHAMRMHDHPALGTKHAPRQHETQQYWAVTAMICGKEKEHAKCTHSSGIDYDAKVLTDFQQIPVIHAAGARLPYRKQ